MSGETRWVQLAGRTARDRSGAVTHYRHGARSIERKRSWSYDSTEEPTNWQQLRVGVLDGRPNNQRHYQMQRDGGYDPDTWKNRTTSGADQYAPGGFARRRRVTNYLAGP